MSEYIEVLQIPVSEIDKCIKIYGCTNPIFKIFKERYAVIREKPLEQQLEDKDITADDYERKRMHGDKYDSSTICQNKEAYNDNQLKELYLLYNKENFKKWCNEYLRNR